MAMQTYTKPQQRDTSSELLNFLLQMSSLKERKEYTKLQKEYGKMAKEQLGMAKEVHEAGRPLREEATVTARGRTRIKKGLLLTDKKIAEAQRKYDVAKVSGNTATQAAAARALKVLKDSRRDAPILMEWAFFAEEKGKEQTAENQLLRQQVFSASQGMQTLELMLKQQNMRGQARLKGITDAVKVAGSAGWESVVGNIDRILDPNANIADIVADISRETAAGRGEIAETARTGKWIDPSKFTKTEREKFDPQSLAQYEDAFRNTGRGVETITIARPKSEKRWHWFDNTEMTLTRKRAVEIGVSDLWDAAKSKEADRGQVNKPVSPFRGASAGMTYPHTPKKKTVKEIASEKAKKVKPAGGKTKQKSPYPDYPNAFLEGGVWKVLVDGVKYRIED